MQFVLNEYTSTKAPRNQQDKLSICLPRTEPVGSSTGVLNEYTWRRPRKPNNRPYIIARLISFCHHSFSLSLRSRTRLWQSSLVAQFWIATEYLAMTAGKSKCETDKKTDESRFFCTNCIGEQGLNKYPYSSTHSKVSIADN